ncbi:PD40 domain-containing protein [Algoriphagus resistens]|uniref:PD40 domain-containing protein n=1 Tax=Algoriphagus resistens TaxID=1750590 RepID=UPI0007169298|nr:PD40 domain-containing protein [Algoriphagus resistens]
MEKFYFLILFLFVPMVLFAQEPGQVSLFDKELNRFLNVRDFTVSTDGQEAYFTIQSPAQDISQLVKIVKENGEWSEPELLLFGDPYMYMEPYLTHDGLRLFFASDRPLLDSDSEGKDFDIWYLERQDKAAGWSTPINLGQPVNSELDEFFPTLAENNNLYFTLDSPEGLGKDDIYRSVWENGSYLAPELLSDSINSNGYEFNAFISRREEFILFTKYNEEGGMGSGDLYLSQRKPNGEWEKARNLGMPINTKYMEYCPFYDEENGILYFTSRRNMLVSKEFRDLADFEQTVNEGENGLSKLYQVKLSIRALRQ